MQEATNARKTQINYMIKSLKDKALEKRKEVEQFNQKKIEVQAQVADVKSQVQTNVDQMTTRTPISGYLKVSIVLIICAVFLGATSMNNSQTLLLRFKNNVRSVYNPAIPEDTET